MPDEKTISRKTGDSYEAAYYLMCGANLVAVKSRLVPKQKIKKLFIRHHWTMELDGIPEQAYQDWRNFKAVGSIRDFVSARVRLKKKISEKLGF